MKRVRLILVVFAATLSLPQFMLAGVYSPKRYSGASGGSWSEPANWEPGGIPTATDAIFITNATVMVAAEAVAGSLELIGGKLIVAGNSATVLAQTPSDAARTDPVGLTVAGDLLLAGECSIGGLNQACESYLTVGGDLTLTAAATLAVYAGERLDETFTLGGAQVTVTGTTILENNSWIYPDCDPYSGAPVLFALQRLEIDSGSGFDATQRGWGYRNLGTEVPGSGILYEKVSANYYGTLAPGAGSSYDRGGGHGGKGGNASSTRGLAYDKAYAPLMPGSPNGIYGSVVDNHRRGGGAIRITATSLRLDGALHADAGLQGESADNGYGGSAGGGIWLICDTIDLGLSAHLSAAGGDIISYSSGGGGGRISLAVGLSPAEVAALAAGEEPENLRYAPLTQLSVNVRGGQASGSYAAQAGSATLVQAATSDLFVTVNGSPLAAGTVSPGYGTWRYTPEQTTTHTAPLTAIDPTTAGSVRYTSAGYVLSNATVQVATAATNEVALNVTNNLQLTWLWHNPEYRYRVSAGDHGSIVVSETTNQLFETWVAADNDVSIAIEAVPEAGYRFLCWEGDLLMGQTFKADLTLAKRPGGANVTARFIPETLLLDNKRYSGADGGLWEIAENWTPAGVPTTADAVFITNRTVYIASEAAVGSLVLSEGSLIVAGSKSDVTTQTSRDTERALPVGLLAPGDVWLSGNCSIGGTDQSCLSYLTVGGDLTLTGANKRLAIYAGPHRGTNPFINGGARVTVAGTTTIAAGCLVLPDCDRFSGHPVVFDLQEVVIAETAGFDATQRGWGYVNAGPRQPPIRDFLECIKPDYWLTEALGRGIDYTIGAGHGGCGSGASVTRGRGLAYDNIHAPLCPGSPNGIYNSRHDTWRRGGGVIRLLTSTLLLDGTLLADAGTQSNYGGSSGGAIWLVCDRIASGANAALSATGGRANYNSAGGGGRIAMAQGVNSATLEALAFGAEPEGLLYDELAFLDVDVAGGMGSNSRQAEAGTTSLVRNVLADKRLEVSGVPLALATPQPDYGHHFYQHGQLVTNSVALMAYDPDRDNRVRYYCVGYLVSNAVELVASGNANEVVVALDEDLQLTWLWGAEEVLYEVTAAAYGTIRQGENTGTFSDWVAYGTTTPSIEARPNSGYEFLYWLGEAPYGVATNNPLSFIADRPRRMQALFRKAEAPATRTWNGGTTAPGLWLDPGCWLPDDNIPGRFDHLIIDAGYCTTTNYAECASLTLGNAAILRVAAHTTVANRAAKVDSDKQLALAGVTFDEGALLIHGDLTLQGSAQLGVGGEAQDYATSLTVGGNLTLSDTSALAIYGGPTNQLCDFVTGTASVNVGGLLRIGTGCWVYPISEVYTGGSPRFEANQVVVESGGGFNATKRGFGRQPGRTPITLAPGLGASYNIGAGYGGRGGGVQPSIYGQPYGCAKAPIYPGSPNGAYSGTHANSRRGGGLIRVHAGISLLLAGSAIADGSLTSTFGGSSGGGIWLTAPRLRLLPGSTLQARGGSSNYTYSGGGGGRIALGTSLVAADIEQLARECLPLSRVEIFEDEACQLRFPDVTFDVSPRKVDTGTPAQSAQSGTLVLLDATRHGTIMVLR